MAHVTIELSAGTRGLIDFVNIASVLSFEGLIVLGARAPRWERQRAGDFWGAGCEPGTESDLFQALCKEYVAGL